MIRALALVSLICAGAVRGQGVDVSSPIDLRRDVLMYHLVKGETAERACEIVVRYFGGYCYPSAKEIVLMDQTGNDPAFYAVIKLDPK